MESQQMKHPLRSAATLSGRRMAGARSLWRANGMREEQFGRPVIGIANSFTQFVPGHVHLHEVGQLVKQRIESLGCFAAEFDTIAITAKDRLTRFGYKYLEILFNEYGCNILVLDYEKNDKSVYDELLQDFMSLVASFSGKFYKLRSLRHEQMLLDLAQSNVNEKINNKND